jgi:RHS repeat-associated protein
MGLPNAAVGHAGSWLGRVSDDAHGTAAAWWARLRGEAIASWRTVAASVLLLVGVALWGGLAGEHSVLSSVVRSGARLHRGLSSLPLVARGVVSAALGGDSRAYRVSRLGGGYQAANPAQRLRVRFDRAGVRVQSGKAQLGLRLGAVGYGASLVAPARAVPQARSNRVVYVHGGLSEWYANGPLGLEQGFTLAQAPAGSSAMPLTLSLALDGNTHASVDASGRSLTLAEPGGSSLRYDNLLATDARGRTLHSWITLRAERVLLHVDAHDARYPLQIDPLIQQGAKLTGKEETGAGVFGESVAISADGNTALIGGSLDNKEVGAAWVFTRSEGKWTQQGAKLTGKEETGAGHFGWSVGLSADGNTALIGGFFDNKEVGAAWVFTRSEGKWTQQAKLTGKEETGAGWFGYSVGLSSDGNTALVSGVSDSKNVGAAWVFTRSEGKWTQQGGKITGKEETGEGRFGYSAALSADGNTLLIGGESDNTFVGAAWVFTRSEGKWTQQGGKITGKEELTEGHFGERAALSADGNTALIGSYLENKSAGAAWVFTRSEGKWTQQGAKLSAKEETGAGQFGWSLALSADGSTAVFGGPTDNSVTGAAWVFARFENKWAQQGAKLTGKEETGAGAFGSSVALSPDASTAVIGGETDKSSVGAAWMFAAAFSNEESYGCENEGEPNLHWYCISNTVNVATGNLSETQSDLAIAGRGPGLQLERTYNSQLAATASTPGPFGYGWSASYSAHLVVNEAAGTASVYQDNGSAVVFSITASKEYVGIGPWVQATLVKEGTGYIYTLPDQTTLEFNSAGQLTKEADHNGNAVTLAYNAEKRLETATDGDARKLTFKYNAGGQVESVKDQLGHTVKYTYEGSNLASVTLPGEEKATWKFEYNASHELTKLTDGRGNTTTMEYDVSHRVTSQVDPLKRERKLKYATIEGGTETTATEPNAATTVAQFNGVALPTKITHASGTTIAATSTYEYQSSAYNTIAFTDPNKHTIKYAYNAADDMTSEVDASGGEQKWTYDSKHYIESETTPRGETTTIKRNAKGDPEVIERPIGAEKQKTEYKYNEKGDITEAVDSLKHVTKYAYDAAGDKESETDPEGDERRWKYDEDSEKTEETDPRKFATKTELNERGEPIKVTDPLGHTTKYTYDADGNVETSTDGNGHTTKYTYDADNELTKTEEPNKTTIERGYDNQGALSSQTDGGGSTRKYERNKLEEIAEEVDPLKHTTKKEYDAAGNLTKEEDPEKHTVTYKYDPDNRTEEISYSTGKPSSIKYEYNKDGRVTKMTDGTGETVTTYDTLDRVTESKNGAGKVLKYEYDLAGDPTKITYPNGKAVTRAYDKDNRLEQITDWNSRSDTFGYTADSQLASITYPAESKYEDKYTYDEADQPTEIKLTKGGETTSSQVYTRDSDGQLKKTTNKGWPGTESSEYKYDEDNRLTEAGGLAYEYDKANNPTKIEGKGAYTYNSDDELEKGPEATYTYNEDGRRTESKPTKGPATSYGYDQVGNLTSVKRAEEGETKKIEDTYTYDGNNLRQSQTINGTTTNLTWDSSERGVPRVLSDESNFYIYGPEDLAIEQITSGGATQWMHHDQQGSMRMIMNLKGEIEVAYTFNPYGSLNSSSHANNSLLRYDDEYTSTDNELIYLRSRTYDPKTAQFLSVDPALASTGEPYAYSKDNPLNGSDPTGLNSYGICGQGTGNFGPVEVGVFSVCSITSVRDAGVTFSFSGAVALDVQMMRRMREWILGRGPAGARAIAAANLGVGAHVSNARSICQLSGASRTRRGSLGWGRFSVSYERFWGPGNATSGSITAASYGWGIGGGINAGGADGASGTLAYSWLDGLC